MDKIAKHSRNIVAQKYTPKWRYHFPTSLSHMVRQFVPLVVFMCLVIAILVSSVQAMKLPSEYGYGQCSMIAEEFHKENGGKLVTLIPNDYPQNIGHTLNKLKIGGVIYYIDYGNQRIFNNSHALIEWYSFENRNRNGFIKAVLVDSEII